MKSNVQLLQSLVESFPCMSYDASINEATITVRSDTINRFMDGFGCIMRDSSNYNESLESLRNLLIERADVLTVKIHDYVVISRGSDVVTMDFGYLDGVLCHEFAFRGDIDACEIIARFASANAEFLTMTAGLTCEAEDDLLRLIEKSEIEHDNGNLAFWVKWASYDDAHYVSVPM